LTLIRSLLIYRSRLGQSERQGAHASFQKSAYSRSLLPLKWVSFDACLLCASERQGAHAATVNLNQAACAMANEKSQRTSTDVNKRDLTSVKRDLSNRSQRTSTDVNTDVQAAERVSACHTALESRQPKQLQAGRKQRARDSSDLAGGGQKIAINHESTGHKPCSDESCSDKLGTYSESSQSEIEAAGARSHSASDDALVQQQQQQQQEQILTSPLHSVFI
jgi:hypothetical protein